MTRMLVFRPGLDAERLIRWAVEDGVSTFALATGDPPVPERGRARRPPRRRPHRSA